jgi:hypothetical protein
MKSNHPRQKVTWGYNHTLKCQQQYFSSSSSSNSSEQNPFRAIVPRASMSQSILDTDDDLVLNDNDDDYDDSNYNKMVHTPFLDHDIDDIIMLDDQNDDTAGVVADVDIDDDDDDAYEPVHENQDRTARGKTPIVDDESVFTRHNNASTEADQLPSDPSIDPPPPRRRRLTIQIPNYEPPQSRRHQRSHDNDDDDDNDDRTDDETLRGTNDKTTTTTTSTRSTTLTPYKVGWRKAHPMQDRVAAQRLQYMEERTQHILSQPSFRTVQVTTKDLQSIYLYWLSRPVRDMFYNKAELAHDMYRPIQHAYNMVRWFMHQFDYVAVNDQERHIIANAMLTFVNSHHETKNTGLCRLMSFFCQPLQGTNATIKEFGGRRLDDNNAKVHVTNLLSAGRVHQILQRMHDDTEYFPDVIPDETSYQSTLNLIGKRCRLLVLLGPPPLTEGMHFPRIRRGIRWSDPETIEALGGCRTTRDCVRAARQVIQQMKDDPHCPNPSMIHYSLLLSMMSYSAGLNVGMAEEAYNILQELEKDPSIENSIALYNPVLLAYVMEAAEHHKRQNWEQKRFAQQRCELIWDTMRNHPSNDPAIISDPISYSIMIKLYRNLDEAAKAQEILESMEAAAVIRHSARTESSTLTDTIVTEGDLPDTATTIHESMALPPDPTLMHYNAVLNAWAKSTDLKSGERAMALVRRMEEKTLAITGMPHPIVPRPDHVSFTSSLDALLRGPNVSVTISHIEQILQRFEASEEVERRPDAVTYNVIFHSLNRQIRKQRESQYKAQIADEMEHLLYRLQSDSPNFRMVAASRIYRYYNECLRAWSATNAPEAPARALRLLHNMDEVCANGSFPAARPNGTTYQHILFALSRASDNEYAEFCQKIFTKMETDNVPVTVTALLSYLGRLLRYRFEGTQDEADDAFIEVLMERFRAKENRNDAFVAGMVFEGIFSNINKESDVHQKIKWARRYEKLFRALLKEPALLRLNNQGQDLAFFYNSCIKAWAFARAPESTAHALRLLWEMEDICRTTAFVESDFNNCRPNVKTYEYILTCLSRVPDLTSLNTARDIFHKMDVAKIPITLSLLNRFIRILSYSGASGALREAEHILKIVEDDFLAKREGSLCPNYMSYSILVEGHLRSKDGLRDAERILDHMKALSEKSGISELLPSPKLYINLINRWSESVAADAIEQIDILFKKMAEIAKPGNYEYSILQNAWCRSNRPDAPQQVESILVAMQQDYEKGNNPAARPAIENFDLVIKAWAISLQPNSVERADAILKRLEDLCYSDRGAYSTMKPTTTCYQHALLGWTLSESRHAGERALVILDRMKQYQKNHAAPAINQACYHHTIVAIGKSDTKNKAKKCYALLEEMRRAYEMRMNRYSWPTHETFQSILGVCATCTNSSADKDEALDICIKTMKEYLLMSHMGPRKDVYVQFLYAVFRLLPPGTERDNVVLSIFADKAYGICPAPIFDAISVRDALTKTVSPKVFADIARICGRNPMLKSLNRVRFT